jgi:hypothetical protein
METCQALITRLPYAPKYDAEAILKAADQIDSRGLLFVSCPIHTESPEAPWLLLSDLMSDRRNDAGQVTPGLKLVSVVSWLRDRLIVVIRSKRLTNSWEPIFILAKNNDYIFDREAVMKVKKGLEGRAGAFDEDEFKTCVGDHWPIRNDRRDRRYLPAQVVINAGQLAGVQPGGKILDLHHNPSIKEACEIVGWKYVDGGLASHFRRNKV